jgi:hypothetical protein
VRTLSGPVLAAIATGRVGLAQFVFADLSVPQYINTSGWDIDWNGHTWLGGIGIGTIDTIEDSPGEVKGLRFDLSGVPSSLIAVSLAEPLQGKVCTIYTAIFDLDAFQVLDGYVEWSGFLDTMQLQEQNATAAISVTAEHAGIDLIRARVSKYTAQDQKLIDPADLGFQYVIDQSDQPIVWPAASFFRT